MAISDQGRRKNLFLTLFLMVSLVVGAIGSSNGLAASGASATTQTGSSTADFEPAKYEMEDVAGVWMDGYLNGPAQGAITTVAKIAMDSEGNIFVADMRGSTGNRIRVIATNGRMYNIAGNGVAGFKDGPADTAMFNFGGSGYKFVDLALDSKRNIYVADGYNNRIRMISQEADGLWWVNTFAGGGPVSLQRGKTGSATDLNLGNVTAVAVDIYDNVWTADMSCLYKITPSGNAYCFNNPAGKPNNMQSDKIGNVYLQVRQSRATPYWRVRQDGTMVRIAGLTDAEYDALPTPKPIDGPTALQSFFWSHDAFAVSNDGSTIYGGNGDECVLRRVYQNGQSRSLYRDGWHRETINVMNGWQMGGPVGVDSLGDIYITAGNPPEYFRLRMLVPVPK